MNRAYAVLDIRAVQEDQRVIEGIASTPTPDRMGDIVEPMGAKFRLPMPLLWQHRPDSPVGHVEFAKPTKDGIPFKARIEQIDEPGELKNLLDRAWQSVKKQLVRAVSIGFNTLSYEIMKDGGYRYTEWEWLELSLVTIPANADATIQTIRSIDSEARAASGRDLSVTAPEQGAANPPGVSGPHKAQQAQEANRIMAKKTIAEQIAGFEAQRTAKEQRLTDIMDKAADENVTLDAAQKDDYDTLRDEVRSIDEHLVRLREHEAANIARAKAVDSTADAQTQSAARGGEQVQQRRAVSQVVGHNLPKGTGFTRFVIAMGRAKGNLMLAHEIAKQWHDQSPEVETVLKSAISAGTTTDSTWASPLVVYQNMANEFIELLHPETIVGRLAGVRRVPFNIKVPRQTSGSSVNWVGESKVKPVSALAFDQLSLGRTKIAGIVPLSDELLRDSSPSAEAIVRQDLIAAIAEFLDVAFIDPTAASGANVNPASVTYGVTPVTATGTTGAALRADVRTLMATFLAANLSATGLVWVMTSQQALAISMILNALGQPEFPGISMTGGTFYGIPVITSENVPSVGDSPTDGSRIVLIKQPEVMLADDGGVTIDVSNEASLQMDSTPDSPPTASTVLVSLWQHNLTAFKVERYINWLKRRDTAVGFINYAKYAE